MKPISYLKQLRSTRRRCKSQAFVEFAFVLPIFLTPALRLTVHALALLLMHTH